MSLYVLPSISFRLPTCGCLQTLGATATILFSIVMTTTFSNNKDRHGNNASLTTTFPAPLLTPTQSALLLTAWLTAIAYMDCASKCWQQRQKERALRAAVVAQHEAVMHELVTTGLLSHVMRHHHTRILPWIYQQQQQNKT